MANIEITAQKKDGSRTVSAFYDFGDNLDEMKEKFGDEVVFTNARANMKITAQSIIRRGIDKEESDEAIQETLAGWKPGVAIQKSSDPLAAALRVLKGKSAEEQAEYIKQLQSMLAGA